MTRIKRVFLKDAEALANYTILDGEKLINVVPRPTTRYDSLGEEYVPTGESSYELFIQYKVMT
jgi:hypothetical protein